MQDYPEKEHTRERRRPPVACVSIIQSPFLKRARRGCAKPIAMPQAESPTGLRNQPRARHCRVGFRTDLLTQKRAPERPLLSGMRFKSDYAARAAITRSPVTSTSGCFARYWLSSAAAFSKRSRRGRSPSLCRRMPCNAQAVHPRMAR